MRTWNCGPDDEDDEDEDLDATGLWHFPPAMAGDPPDPAPAAADGAREDTP